MEIPSQSGNKERKLPRRPAITHQPDNLHVDTRTRTRAIQSWQKTRGTNNPTTCWICGYSCDPSLRPTRPNKLVLFGEQNGCWLLVAAVVNSNDLSTWLGRLRVSHDWSFCDVTLSYDPCNVVRLWMFAFWHIYSGFQDNLFCFLVCFCLFFH